MRKLLIPLIAATVLPLPAHATTYETFTPFTYYQECLHWSVVLLGGTITCGGMESTGASIDTELVAEPDGDFVASIQASGGNPVAPPRIQAIARLESSLTLDAPAPVIDISFDFTVDEMAYSGDRFCGASDLGNPAIGIGLRDACTSVSGEANAYVYSPSGGSYCADGSSTLVGFTSGTTRWGPDVNGADTPGQYSGNYRYSCQSGASFATGSRFHIWFYGNAMASTSGPPSSATIRGSLQQVRFETA